MSAQTPVVFINGLIGCLEHPSLHAALAPRPVRVPELLGYGRSASVAPDGVDIPAQIEHLHRLIGDQRVHLVGHSVGGAIALLYASRHPQSVASVVSVEGNFSLKDAFWSSKVARMSAEEAQALLQGYRADPAGWLAGAGIAADPGHLETAIAWLAYQPASTLQAMARSVLAETAEARYPATLQALFDTLPVHLLAGAHSRDGWDVPEWALRQAASMTVMPQVGHLMMLEQPAAFARIIAKLLD